MSTLRTERGKAKTAIPLRREASAVRFSEKDHLDFAKGAACLAVAIRRRVQLGWFVRLRTHLLSNLIDSAQNPVENRIEAVSRLYPTTIAATSCFSLSTT